MIDAAAEKHDSIKKHQSVADISANATQSEISSKETDIIKPLKYFINCSLTEELTFGIIF